MKKLPSRILMTALVVTSLSTGCGRTSDNSNEQTKVDPIPAYLGLPDAAVIAVPVDQSGHELTQQADLRLIPQSPENLTGEAIQTAYRRGHHPDVVLDELDTARSTESFQGWGPYRRIGQPGYGFGYNDYQPIYYHGGNPYRWRFLNQHRCGNMNYYYYHRRPQTWGTPWNQPRPIGYDYGHYGSYQHDGNYGQFGQIQPIGYR